MRTLLATHHPCNLTEGRLCFANKERLAEDEQLCR